MKEGIAKRITTTNGTVITDCRFRIRAMSITIFHPNGDLTAMPLRMIKSIELFTDKDVRRTPYVL